MQHEAVGILALQRVDGLRIAHGTQRRHHQRLCLAAGEQHRTMGTRQHAGTDGDRAHGACVATVDTRFAAQDLAAHDLGFQRAEQFADLVLGDVLEFRCRQRFGYLGTDRIHLLGARLFLTHGVSGLQVALGQRIDLGDQRFVLGGRCPVPIVLANRSSHFVDGVDHGLHLLVAEHHCAQHDVFRQLLRFGFHHQYRFRRTGDHQIHLRLDQFILGRVQHILAVEVTHARCADGAVERDAGDRQRGGSADHGGNIGIDLRIGRHHGRHDLHFVVETFREQRTQRTVDQARGQDLLFAGTAFALEETAGDLARSVGALLIIHGQREKILVGFGILASHHGDQHHGVVQTDHDCTTGLARDLAGLQCQLMFAVAQGFFIVTQDSSLQCICVTESPAELPAW